MNLPITFVRQRAMLGYGRQIRGRQPWRLARSVCLAAGAFAVCFGLTLCAMEYSNVHWVQSHAQDLLAKPPTASAKASFLVANGFQTIQHRQVFVVVVLPLNRHAPVPPGLKEWPEAGHAAVSPSVKALIGHGRSPFGPIQMTIGQGGLETSTDYRVYVRPTPAAATRYEMTPASGFGRAADPVSSVGLGYLSQTQMSNTLGLVLLALVAPGLVAVSAGSGIGSHTSRRRSARLRAIGASRIDLTIIRWADSGGALAIGVAAATLLTVTLISVPVRISAVNALTHPAALRAYPILIGAAVLLGAAIILVLQLPAAFAWRRSKYERPFQEVDQPSNFRAALGLVAAIACVWLPEQLVGVQQLLAYLICVGIVAVTTPVMASIAIRQLGTFLVRVSTEWGSAGALLAGRQLVARPSRTGRLIFCIVVSILCVGQIQMWTSLLGSSYYSSEYAQQVVRGTAMASASGALPARTGAFVDRLPRGTGYLVFDTTASTPRQPRFRSTVYGSCASLRTIGASCSTSGGTVVLSRLSRRQQVIVGEAIPPSGILVAKMSTFGSIPSHGEAAARRLVLVSTNGERLNSTLLISRSFTYVAGGLELQPVGDEWITQANVNLNRSTWVMLYGVFGVLILIAAAACVMVSDVVVTAQRVAGLGAVFGRGRWPLSYTLWSTGLPVAIGGTIAALAYYWLPVSMTAPEARLVPSAQLAWVFACASTVVGVVATAVGASTVFRMVRNWRPGEYET